MGRRPRQRESYDAACPNPKTLCRLAPRVSAPLSPAAGKRPIPASAHSPAAVPGLA
jgi:hypothetical protein